MIRQGDEKLPRGGNLNEIRYDKKRKWPMDRNRK